MGTFRDRPIVSVYAGYDLVHPATKETKYKDSNVIVNVERDWQDGEANREKSYERPSALRRGQQLQRMLAERAEGGVVPGKEAGDGKVCETPQKWIC